MAYPVGLLMYNVVCKMKHVVLKGILNKLSKLTVNALLTLLLECKFSMLI